MIKDRAAKAVEKALDLLRREGRELVCTCTRDSVSGRAFFIMPDEVRVTEATVLKLLENERVQPYSDGLFPGCTQAWRYGPLGAWRTWKRR